MEHNWVQVALQAIYILMSIYAGCVCLSVSGCLFVDATSRFPCCPGGLFSVINVWLPVLEIKLFDHYTTVSWPGFGSC